MLASSIPLRIATFQKGLGVLFLLVFLKVCFLPLPSRADARVATPQALAPKVFFFRGADGPASPQNQGAIGNAVFFVQAQGVVLVNPGPNRRVAQAREAAIRQQTGRPIVAVVITHARPEQALGAGYFQQQGIPVRASATTRARMAERCEACLADLALHAGQAAMQGTTIVLPSPDLQDGARLPDAAGTLRVLVPPDAAIPGNTLVFDEASGILASGLVARFDQIPDLHDADLPALIATLDDLTRRADDARHPIRLIVPDRGPPSPPARLGELRHYLAQLLARVQQAYDRGVSLAEAEAFCQLPEFMAWPGYADQHAVNVRQTYLWIEQQDLQPTR